MKMEIARELCTLAEDIRTELSQLGEHATMNRRTEAGECFDNIMSMTADIKRVAYQNGGDND